MHVDDSEPGRLNRLLIRPWLVMELLNTVLLYRMWISVSEKELCERLGEVNSFEHSIRKFIIKLTYTALGIRGLTTWLGSQLKTMCLKKSA